MKKLFKILMVTLMLFSIGATVTRAQTYPLANTVNTMVSRYGNIVDTVTSATKYMYSNLTKPVKGDIKTLNVVVNLAEISGTTGGAITLETSIDDTTWYPYHGLSGDTIYTFTPLDAATNSYRWRLTDPKERFLRIKYVPTGTMSDKMYGKFYY